jgi:integrase
MFTTALGEPIHPRNFSRTWTSLREKAGVRHVRFHDLRHMYVSLLHNAGVDIATIAKRVGHTDPAFTLRRYSYVFKEQNRAAAIPLSELLNSAKKKKL